MVSLQLQWCVGDVLLIIFDTLGRYKNGKVLPPSDTVRITSDGNRHKLAIAAIVKSDEGEYTYEVSSSAGSASCSATLAIQGGHAQHVYTAFWASAVQGKFQ